MTKEGLDSAGLEIASVLEAVTADQVEEELPRSELADDEKGAVGVTALLAVLLVLSEMGAELLFPVLEGEAPVLNGGITVPVPVTRDEVPFDHVDVELAVSDETGMVSVKLPDTFAEGLAIMEEWW